MLPLPDNIIPLPMRIVKEQLESIYGKGRRWSDYEIHTLADICRHPSCQEECQMILDFYSTLPAGSKMFPFSVMRLLEKWTEVLDRARLSKVKRISGPVRDPKEVELRKVQAEMTSIKYSHWDLNKSWDCELSKERYFQLKQRKYELLVRIEQ